MPKIIQDEFTKLNKKMCRQQIWQLRRVRDGKCMVCGLRAMTKMHCLKHAQIACVRNKRWRLSNGLTKEHKKPIADYNPYGKRNEA